MKIIVLDCTDWKVKIVNNLPEKVDNNDYEIFLSDKYNFYSSNIQYMVVPELEIETFN